MQDWNRETSAWKNFNRYDYTYNGTGKLRTSLFNWWADAWITTQRYTYSYTGNKLTKLLEENFYSEVPGEEGTKHQAEYTYNSNGTLRRMIWRAWRESENKWINSSRIHFGYITHCALPLTFPNFTGTKNNNSVLLSWKTANEVNTSYFVVQRSLDGVDFDDIKIVDATSVSVTKTYSSTDNVAEIKALKIYYRLTMVDKDGKSEVSKVVPLTLANQGQRFTIKPNPANNYFIISQDRAEGTLLNALVNITDFMGRTVFKQAITLSGEQKINISALSKGIYMITINTGNNITTQKLVIE